MGATAAAATTNTTATTTTATTTTTTATTTGEGEGVIEILEECQESILSVHATDQQTAASYRGILLLSLLRWLGKLRWVGIHIRPQPPPLLPIPGNPLQHRLLGVPPLRPVHRSCLSQIHREPRAPCCGGMRCGLRFAGDDTMGG